MIPSIKKIIVKLKRFFNPRQEEDIFRKLNGINEKHNCLIRNGRICSEPIYLNIFYQNEYIFSIYFIKIFTNIISLYIVPRSHNAMNDELYLQLSYNSNDKSDMIKMRRCRDYCDEKCFCTYVYNFTFKEYIMVKENFLLKLHITNNEKLNLKYISVIRKENNKKFIKLKINKKLKFPYKQIKTEHNDLNEYKYDDLKSSSSSILYKK